MHQSRETCTPTSAVASNTLALALPWTSQSCKRTHREIYSYAFFIGRSSTNGFLAFAVSCSRRHAFWSISLLAGGRSGRSPLFYTPEGPETQVRPLIVRARSVPVSDFIEEVCPGPSPKPISERLPGGTQALHLHSATHTWSTNS